MVHSLDHTAKTQPIINPCRHYLESEVRFPITDFQTTNNSDVLVLSDAILKKKGMPLLRKIKSVTIREKTSQVLAFSFINA